MTKSVDRPNCVNGDGTSQSEMPRTVGQVLDAGVVKPSSDYITLKVSL